jgi:excisionase family DNA binding protein
MTTHESIMHKARGKRKDVMVERLAYGLGEVAGMLGVSASFMRLEVARGRLGVFHLGKRTLISREALDEYLAAYKGAR